MKKIVAYVYLISSLSACAIVKEPIVIKPSVIKEEQQKVKFLGHEVKECNSTQRDLSLAWELRQYWCSDKNKIKKLQKINNDVLEIENQKYIAEVDDEANQLEFIKIKEETPVKIKSLGDIIYPKIKVVTVKNIKKDSKPIVKKLKAVPIKKQNTKFKNINGSAISVSTIYFAKNIRVLGPQGQEATLALIPKVKTASKINLRGLILPDEVLVNSDIYKEKVSVGRALAVRKLWVENGIDIKKIKILHHNPKLMGRTVEVYFND